VNQQKAIRKAIKKLRSSLKWRVLEKCSSDSTLHILSDHLRKEHVIYIPSGNQADPLRPTEYLHELCHAKLAETVHLQFSAQNFKRGTPDEQIRQMAIACRVASDWFADELLYSLVPEDFKAEVAEHFDLITKVLSQSPPGEPFLVFSAGLIIAQAIRYLDQKVEARGDLGRVVDALLGTDPAKPSIQTLEDLLNRLLKTYSGYQVRLVDDGGVEVWEAEANKFLQIQASVSGHRLTSTRLFLNFPPIWMNLLCCVRQCGAYI